VALVAPLVPFVMRRANRACVVGGMLLDAVVTAVFPWCSGAAAWHLLRLLGGAGTALSLIPMETLVNHDAAPEHRARDFGIYAFCVALGIALGSVVGLPLYPWLPRLTFALGGTVTLLAIGFALAAIPAGGRYETVSEEEACLPVTASVLSLGTAWAQGFLEGGTITFLSIYLLALGYTEAGTGTLLGGLFAGVILAQLPLATLADRIGRLRVLLLCHALVLTGLICVPFARSPLPLGGWLFLLGATCGALYPLGLALLGERVPPAGLAKANAWYLASNCAGSLSGPLLIGLAIDGFGLRAQFAVGAAAVLLVVGAWMVLAQRSGDRSQKSEIQSKEPSKRVA
jgi:MFS family permease